jgi:hypothetical protein
MSFADTDYLIRPVRSVKELVDEGKTLKHCVGGYVERVAKGESNILVIRRVFEPDKPFFTVVIRKEDITQCYGLSHCHPDSHLRDFIERFKIAKLTKSKKQREVAV